MTEEPQVVTVTFYKESGKYYTSGTAVVTHFLFEDEYLQDIVDTQRALQDGWQEGPYYVVVSSNDTKGFHEALYLPGSFAGLTRRAN
jgi:hypothetical protein